MASPFISMHRLLLTCAVFMLVGCSDDGRGSLERALLSRGRIALVTTHDLGELRADGMTFASLPPGATNERDGAAFVASLTQAKLAGVLVDAREPRPAAGTVLARLASYGRVGGLVGVHLSPLGALYVLDPVSDWSPALRAGLAEVARRLVGGEQPPRIASFPAAVRKVEPVEVMVLLRSGAQPRLWRSARGSSFARALLTAAEVARKRWIEREQSMGGPINTLLPRLSVEVALLQDDGEIGVRDAPFIDRVVSPVHGVAYERKGAWRYLLPEATHKHGRRPSTAYEQLFVDDGLPEDSARVREIRLYRVAVTPIGVSPPSVPAQRPPRDAVSDVASPDEVLGPKTAPTQPEGKGAMRSPAAPPPETQAP